MTTLPSDAHSSETGAEMQAPADPYADIADWYDIEHDHFSADVEFYQAVITSPSGARINALEIGSGTGRLAAALALAGWAITGVEPSTAMRTRCVARLAKLPPAVARRIHIVAGTATALNLPTPPTTGVFDTAIVALGTFAHLTSEQERTLALQAIHPQLCAGGSLVIDLDLDGPRYLLEHPDIPVRLGVWPLRGDDDPSHQAPALPGQQRRLTHIASGAAGPAPGTLTIHHNYIVTQGRREISRTTTTTTLALLTADQVADELRQAGYHIAAVYGDYSMAALADDAPRALMVATR